MSIRYIITPYDPEHLQAATSDLQLDVNSFKDSLVDRWRDAKVEATPRGGLLWLIPDSTSVGFRGELQANRQIVTFAPGNWKFFIEFVLWYRKQVPENYPLHLFNSSSTKSLVISSQTTTDDIERFVSEERD